MSVSLSPHHATAPFPLPNHFSRFKFNLIFFLFSFFFHPFPPALLLCFLTTINSYSSYHIIRMATWWADRAQLSMIATAAVVRRFTHFWNLTYIHVHTCTYIHIHKHTTHFLPVQLARLALSKKVMLRAACTDGTRRYMYVLI
jgi:hypothetical protein